ncbi:MAG: FHA domain-containing protein [Prevotellaceae bacterium]|nr:FHA domain-containing protein [Prevotellaceae bacterium]
MSDDTIKIGCPLCGAILLVRNQPGLESKSVTCPVCKTVSPFRSYKRVADAEAPTEVNIGLENQTVGKLCLAGSDVSFPLQMGMNLIGRRAAGSSAAIQLPDAGKRMSRDHLDIEVKHVPGRGIVHYVSLHKRQVNPTYIGDTLLEFGDKVVLKSHDIIRLPDVDVIFLIPDEEETELTPHAPRS